jgi:hypothetical protein
MLSCFEWTGTLAGTLDQSADNSAASGTTQRTGVITPTRSALMIAVCATASGATEMTIRGPNQWNIFQGVNAGYASIVYAVSDGSEATAVVTAQANAAWANTIVSVV